MFTEEQRLAGQEAKRIKREQGLSTYKTDFAEDSLWTDLAKEAGIKLPQHHIAPSGRKLNKLAEQLGLPDSWGEAMFGINFTNTTAAVKLENSRRADGEKYNHRCMVGHLLEMWKEIK